MLTPAGAGPTEHVSIQDVAQQEKVKSVRISLDNHAFERTMFRRRRWRLLLGTLEEAGGDVSLSARSAR